MSAHPNRLPRLLARDAERIVRFLDGLAEEIWREHGDAIHAVREAREQRRAVTRSSGPGRPKGRKHAEGDDQ